MDAMPEELDRLVDMGLSPCEGELSSVMVLKDIPGLSVVPSMCNVGLSSVREVPGRPTVTYSDSVEELDISGCRGHISN